MDRLITLAIIVCMWVGVLTITHPLWEPNHLVFPVEDCISEVRAEYTFIEGEIDNVSVSCIMSQPNTQGD